MHFERGKRWRPEESGGGGRRRWRPRKSGGGVGEKKDLNLNENERSRVKRKTERRMEVEA